jgi:ATP-dependent Clp protease adaptor protein ClpS
MAESEKEKNDEGGAGTATAAPPAKPQEKEKKKPSPKKRPPGLMPRWRVLLHNDDKNDMMFVVVTIMELTRLQKEEAVLRTLEAHKTGVALLLTTHQELAELYKDQFTSKGLTVTIEPEK